MSAGPKNRLRSIVVVLARLILASFVFAVSLLHAAPKHPPIIIIPGAPGTELVSGPSHITVRGRGMEQLVLTVRKDRGCDPGYFYSWRTKCWGPCWTRTKAGDTIRVWIIKMGATRIVVEAETAERAGPTLEQEIQRIVGSMRIDDRHDGS